MFQKFFRTGNERLINIVCVCRFSFTFALTREKCAHFWVNFINLTQRLIHPLPNPVQIFG
jgi:hypothetical protein